MLEDKIEQLKKEALESISKVADLSSLELLKIKYLGRKGEVSSILRSLADLNVEEKRRLGPLANSLKNNLTALIIVKEKDFGTKNKNQRFFDVTRPGKKIEVGHLHPLSIVEKEIRDI